MQEWYHSKNKIFYNFSQFTKFWMFKLIKSIFKSFFNSNLTWWWFWSYLRNSGYSLLILDRLLSLKKSFLVWVSSANFEKKPAIFCHRIYFYYMITVLATNQQFRGNSKTNLWNYFCGLWPSVVNKKSVFVEMLG